MKSYKKLSSKHIYYGVAAVLGVIILTTVFKRISAPTGINEVGIVGSQGGFMFKWNFDDLRDIGPNAWQFIGASTKPKNVLRITESERYEILGPITTQAALVNKNLKLIPFKGATSIKVEFDLRSNYQLFIPRSRDNSNEEPDTTDLYVLGTTDVNELSPMNSDSTNKYSTEELAIQQDKEDVASGKEAIPPEFADLLQTQPKASPKFNYPMKIVLMDQNGILRSSMVEAQVTVQAGTSSLQHYSVTLNTSKMKLNNPMLSIYFAPSTSNLVNVQIDNIQVSSPLKGQMTVIKEGPTTVTGTLKLADPKAGYLGTYILVGEDGITYDLIHLAVDPAQLKSSVFAELAQKMLNNKVVIDGDVRQNVRRNESIGPVLFPQLVVKSIRLAK